MQKINRVNVEQIASLAEEDLQVSKRDILRVFNSQFLFISNHIKKEREGTIKLDYFGKFLKKGEPKKKVEDGTD